LEKPRRSYREYSSEGILTNAALYNKNGEKTSKVVGGKTVLCDERKKSERNDVASGCAAADLRHRRRLLVEWKGQEAQLGKQRGGAE